MRRLFQVICFLLASSIEVQVHARIIMLPNQSEIMEEPKGCLWASSTCALKTQPGFKFETKIGASTILMGSDTILVRLAQDAFLLVQGEAWVKSQGKMTARSEYGDVASVDGEMWILRSPQRVIARAIRGTAEVFARNSEDCLPLPEGFEIQLTGVTKTGRALASLPTVINFRDHLRRWARLYKGPKKEFIHEIHRFDPILRQAARQSSEFHSTTVQRQLASQKVEFEKIEKQRQQYERESKRIRALFEERALR